MHPSSNRMINVPVSPSSTYLTNSAVVIYKIITVLNRIHRHRVFSRYSCTPNITPLSIQFNRRAAHNHQSAVLMQANQISRVAIEKSLQTEERLFKSYLATMPTPTHTTVTISKVDPTIRANYQAQTMLVALFHVWDWEHLLEVVTSLVCHRRVNTDSATTKIVN